MTRSRHQADAPAQLQPTSQDRRALLGKLALGGAGAAVGAVLVSGGSAKAAPAGEYNAITPQRAYDSRQPNYDVTGVLAPNSDRVISVADGHNASGTVTLADAVPDGATAVHINVTAAEMDGRNFLSVTAGDTTSTETSLVNWEDGATQIANAVTVPVDADRQVRVFNGDQTGSTHVIIDVFGYYLPTVV